MESHSRSLVKAISYRLLASTATGLLFYALNGNLKLAVGAGVLDTFIKLAIYFIHERLWNHINFGRSRPPEYEI